MFFFESHFCYFYCIHFACMDYPKAEQFIKQLLQTQLSPLLTYHDYDHTFDVVAAAADLARQEGILDETQLTVLKTAALFHDCGYVYTYEHHEEEGCRIARQVLPGFDYTTDQVETVCSMIMKTKLQVKPETLLEKILCDADLIYLGSDEFESRGTKLFHEWLAYGKLSNEREWNDKQIHFLEHHRYCTHAAREQADAKKAEHLVRLKNMVKA